MEISELLLLDKKTQADALISISTNTKYTMLQFASQKGYLKIVKLLLMKNDTNVDSRTQGDNATALHLAANNRHLDVVKLLIEVGKADATAVDSFGRTPLHCACTKKMFYENQEASKKKKLFVVIYPGAAAQLVGH